MSTGEQCGVVGNGQSLTGMVAWLETLIMSSAGAMYIYIYIYIRPTSEFGVSVFLSV